jgi:multidrug efflux pump subunit AcrB
MQDEKNTSQYFVEKRQVGWVLLVATCVWGWYAYHAMPQRKDPVVPVRTAVALVPWPGESALRVEQLVTRRVEEQVAGSRNVTKVESVSRTGMAVVYVELSRDVKDSGKEFDDVRLRLDSITNLPPGAGPIQFIKDFGDTAALMLTVASPPAPRTEVELKGRAVQSAIERARGGASGRISLVICLPSTVSARLAEIGLRQFGDDLVQRGDARAFAPISGPGFAGLDLTSRLAEAALLDRARRFVRERFRADEFHPDQWPPVALTDPAQAAARIAEVAGDRYTYRQLDNFTDSIEKSLARLPTVSRVTRYGVLPEQIFLLYSQARLAQLSTTPAALRSAVTARNAGQVGGSLDLGGRLLGIYPGGEIGSLDALAETPLHATPGGAVTRVRDVADIVRSYESPAQYLNYYTRTSDGRRARAITLAVQMRDGCQIEEVGRTVDAALADVKQRLPEDLITARTSDQPLQVKESVDLFMKSLYEAIALVVLISLIGFWEWRSAVLMALSIPLTLAMTFGMMRLLSIDLQQVSIATLIIALGLLVDDPVVAGDAIKRELAHGTPPGVAAWRGPTKIASAIMFATITNVVAYLPFLILPGDTGAFLYSLPIVITCSLVASRLVSGTFVPLLSYYLLRPTEELDAKQRRGKGFAALYYRLGLWTIAHRRGVLLIAGAGLVAGMGLFTCLKTEFFPKDRSYLATVDVWLPEDAPLSLTNRTVTAVEGEIGRVASEVEHGLLVSLTTFVGAGSPRFWYSLAPELPQLNYAQIVVQVSDKELTAELVDRLQERLPAVTAGARVDARQLETGSSYGLPVAVRISGDSIPELRRLAGQVRGVLSAVPAARGVRDDWGGDCLALVYRPAIERAYFAGLTSADIASSLSEATAGAQATALTEGDRRIPVVARVRSEERATTSDLDGLRSFGSAGSVMLGQVMARELDTRPAKIRRRNQFRTITVKCCVAPGVKPSEVVSAVRGRLTELARTLPPGYRIEYGGEQEKQEEGFADLMVVLAISVAAILLMLVIQFESASKPLIVMTSVPFGVLGAVAALWVMNAPFGFMAFLGVISLVGVVVSHIIVLFDFIEEEREHGAPLEEALLDAGIMRLRPVLITVAATVIALFPLATHGGPLWEPMCYAQIGGLTAATFVTLLLVPVVYSVFVLDLRLVRWEKE